MQRDPAELESERAALIRADRDIAEGEQRLRDQMKLATRLRAAGHEHVQADRLTHILVSTLTEWRVHRDLIQHRIMYLERRRHGDLLSD